MTALIIKSAAVGGVVLIIGLLAQGGRTALAALLIQLPVFSVGALWVAAGLGRDTIQTVSGKALIASVVWISYMGSVFLMLKYTSLPSWAAILIGLGVWGGAAALYLTLVK